MNINKNKIQQRQDNFIKQLEATFVLQNLFRNITLESFDLLVRFFTLKKIFKFWTSNHKIEEQ